MLSTLTYRIPMPTYVVISLLTVTTMGFSNLSLEYLNYPTQVGITINPGIKSFIVSEL